MGEHSGREQLGPVWPGDITLHAAEADGCCYLSSASAGGTWRVRCDDVVGLVAWGARLQSDAPPLAEKLAEATAERGASTAPKGQVPAGRFHQWADAATYLDGEDLDGRVRRTVVESLDPDPDNLYVRFGPREGPKVRVSGELAAVRTLELAMARTGAQRLAASTGEPTKILQSYGAACGFLVVTSGQAGVEDGVHAVAVGAPAEWKRLPIDADPVFDALRLDASTPSTIIAVVGDAVVHQQRYQHEWAARGFFVDGGRVLYETSLAAATVSGTSSHCTIADASSLVGPLGLAEIRYVVFGVVRIPGIGRG